MYTNRYNLHNHFPSPTHMAAPRVISNDEGPGDCHYTSTHNNLCGSLVSSSQITSQKRVGYNGYRK